MSEKKSALRRFFGALWTTVVVIFRLISVASIAIGLLLLWFAVKGGPVPTVEDNVALVIWPSGNLVEQIDSDPGQRFIEEFSGQPPSQTLLRDLIDALEIAAEDSRITAAVLKLDDMGAAGIPQIAELAQAMKTFQAAGKPIYTYAPWYSQMAYLAAAQADEVMLDPMGGVEIEGLSVYNNFFKDALDKLGVQVHVFRVGEYKSAVEPFIRNDMSEEAKKANLDWLGDLWGGYGMTVAKARNLDEQAIDQYARGFADNLAKREGDAAGLAKDSGLVNTLATLQEFRRHVGEKVGMDDDHGSFRQIRFDEYLKAVDHETARSEEEAGEQGRIGLIVVQGEIVDGYGEPGQAGGDSIAELLDEARRDKDISAVVLRVDSPGGSVWASEQIRRGVLALRAEGKPVVVSMSSVAASGGYWVSMDADQIWAHDSTITGSIGIFGLLPTLEKPFDKLGISTDGVGTTPLAGAYRLDRPLSPQLSAIIQSQIEKGYRDFIEGVANGRKLPVEKVAEIARGRVWSGADAKNLGLVDEIGGLERAAASAAKLAGLKDGAWALEELSTPTPFPFDFLRPFIGQSGSLGAWLPAGAKSRLLGWLARTDIATSLRFLNDPRGVYAYCFCTPFLGGR